MTDSNRKEAPLIHKLAQQNNFEELSNLLSQNSSLVHTDNSSGTKPLHSAVKGNSIQCVKLLLEKGADVNARNRDGYTAIFSVSTVDIAEILVENGANLNTVGRYNSTPLKYAIARQHIDVVRYLITQGANVNHVAKLDFRETMTQCALSLIVQKTPQEKKDKALEILEILLEAGANPNIQSVDGTTALHTASLRGLTDFVKLLLKYGADPCIYHRGQKSCFDYVENYPDIVELFEPYKDNLKPLIEIQDSPEKLIERLLNIGFVEQSEFIPCTEAEIEDLEQRNRVKLPESYKKFLRIMGISAGNFLKSDHWEVFYSDFYNLLGVDFYKIPEDQLNDCTQAEIDFVSNIPDNFFIFATRLADYPLGFFR